MYDRLKRWILGMSAPAQASAEPPRTDEDIARLRSFGAPTVHESGHAVVAWFSPFVSSVISAVITPDGRGKVTSKHCRDCPPFDWDMLAIHLAGIAGELTVFGRCRSGNARTDLVEALHIAENLLVGCPQPESAALWSVKSATPTPDFSSFFRASKNPRALRLMEIGYRRSKEIIEARWPPFVRLAEELARRMTLNERELEAILGPPVVMDKKSIERIRDMY